MEARTPSPTLEASTIVERVARIVSSVRGAKPDYARLAAELEPAIPFDVFGIVLLRHDRQAVRVTVCKRELHGWTAYYHQHPLEDSMVERILLQAGSPSQQRGHAQLESASSPANAEPDTVAMIVCNYPGGLDGPPAESGDALSGNPQLHVGLIAPLVVAGRVLGSLELGSTLLGAYADETLQRLIGAVARVLAAAIESAQFGGSVEIQDRQRQALKNVSSALTSEMDLPMILNRIVVGIARALNVASAIVTFDRHTDTLRLQAQSGLNEEALKAIIDRDVALDEQSIIGFTLRRRQPFVSRDIAEEERFPLSRVFASELGIHSVFSYPLVASSSVYGALLLCSPEPGGFTPLKADILSLFASQATIAIHNGMLLESARERRRFQEAVEQLEQAHHLSNWAAEDSQGEQALLQHVRSESERTFGVSFSSLLRFISDHLLARGERNLLRDVGIPLAYGEDQGRTVLIQTAEAALARAGLLGDVGAALAAALAPQHPFTADGSRSSAFPQFYERVARDMTDALFVVDLQGRCIYVNPAAEAFCGMRLDLDSLGTPHLAPSVSLHEVFSGVAPRIRNADEALAYLQTFTRSDLDENEGTGLRCIIAAEVVRKRAPMAFHTPARDAGDKENAEVSGTIEPLDLYDTSITPAREQFASHTMLLDSAPSDRHYQFKRYPLFDQYGQLMAKALHVHDITEQVRDEKNRSVLLSSVSHDLRTPLTTIKAAVTGLLQQGVEWDEETRREILEDIDAETDHLDALVNSLVEMSRIEMGALVLEKEWCDVVEIVYSALPRLERVLAGHPVRTEFESQLPLIQADYVQLQLVLQHLLENAARHSPGKAEICISLDTVIRDSLGIDLPSNSARLLRVRVIDQGRGVPEHERERIFKTFYSLDSQGSGLGLAICRGIVEAHQGRIWVEPVVHGGSSFVFVLPVFS